MLAIVSGFKESRRDIKGTKYPILVFSVLKNLEYFNISKVLDCYQAK
jgi:hypothetical protein